MSDSRRELAPLVRVARLYFDIQNQIGELVCTATAGRHVTEHVEAVSVDERAQAANR